MISLKGEVTGVRETVAAFGQFQSILRQAAMAAMTDSLGFLSRTVRDKYLVGPYPQEIERRTGSFRATFARGHADNIWEVRAQGTQVLGTFGSKDKRARILNDGGIIRPVRSKFLAIRTEFTKTSRGVVREKYRQPLRNIPNTFVVMHASNKGTVFERIGGRRSKRIIPIAWLRLYVFIKGRKFMQKTETAAGPGIQTIFQDRMNLVVDRLRDTLARVR